MNIPLLSVALVIASIGAPPGSVANHNAQRAKELALSADTVVLRGERQPANEGVVVKDRKWIASFAETLGHTDLSKADSVFAVGFLTAYFYRDGEQVLSIAPIDGGGGGDQWIRASSTKGGSDFIVSKKQCVAIEALIREKMGTNHTSDRIPGSSAPGESGAH